MGAVELHDDGMLGGTMVEAEAVLTSFGPVHDSINARGPFGGDLWIGFEATQMGFKPDSCGGVEGCIAMFMHRGAVGGLGRASVVDEAAVGTNGEIN